MENRLLYISSQKELLKFVKRASKSSILAVDTEFLRERTYYPRLCLLQFATDDEVVIVDPFEIDDLTVLRTLFEDESIVKIFHAGYQDIEIIIYDVGCVPRPLFDTQIAASFFNNVYQIGYASLVNQICGVKLKKSDSFTDWSVRPLLDSQLKYAQDDVYYLRILYHEIREILKKRGRLDWLEDELKPLMDRDHYVYGEQEMFRRLKHVGQLNPRQMAAAREVAAWREIEARKRNLPRRHILSDEQIVETCRREPSSLSDLFVVRGMRERLDMNESRLVFSMIRKALDSAPSTWPVLHTPLKNEQNVDIEVEMLASIVRLKAKEFDISSSLMAKNAELAALARGYRDNLSLLQGWRKQIVGGTLVDYLEGKCTLGIINGEPSIVYGAPLPHASKH